MRKPLGPCCAKKTSLFNPLAVRARLTDADASYFFTCLLRVTKIRHDGLVGLRCAPLRETAQSLDVRFQIPEI